jgi:GT2 family glycosyltransferase
VSIIIINCNGKNFLKTCLESLKEQTYKNFEIIFVDNGSDDGSADFVRDNFPDVKVIVNEKNLGFAAPNNQGLKIAKGEYIATLNNDTKVDMKWLENLVTAAKSNKDNAMCGSKILSMTSPKQIDSVGVNICLDGMSRGKGRLENDSGQYDDQTGILFPSACAALYKREMLDETGFFDETFFAYCEDTDLGLRGRLAGWKAVFVPDAVVYHHYSGTGGKASSFKAYLVERNHVWVVLKNFPLPVLALTPFFTFYRFILHIIAVFFKKGATSKLFTEVSSTEFIKVVLKAYFDAVKRLPEFIKKRRFIQTNKKISTKEFISLLIKYNLSLRELVFKE